MKNNDYEVDFDKITSIFDVISANYNAGMYFFSAPTMKFFSSRYYDEIVAIPDLGVLFITSERCFSTKDNRRMYTVRALTKSGHISDISRFQQFASIEQARRFMKEYTKVYQELVKL